MADSVVKCMNGLGTQREYQINHSLFNMALILNFFAVCRKINGIFLLFYDLKNEENHQS